MPRHEPTPPGLLPALRSNAWFGGCPEDFQQALLDRSRLVRLAAREALFVRGDAADGLCCVIAGLLEVGAVHGDGTHTLLATVEPYQWFGEISMLDGLPRTHDAVADPETAVLVVPQAELHGWLAAHPQHWQHLAQLACGKLRLLFGVLEDIQLLSLEQRLAKRLWLAAHGYDTSASPPVPRRTIRVPQEQLALMMGVTRQSVNKALRKLEAQGLVALRYGAIELVDLAALQRLAAD